MARIRTFADSCLLISGALGKPLLGDRAVNVLSDKGRTFVTSPFVELEVMPKAVYAKNTDEIEFYETYFASAEMIDVSPRDVLRRAREIAIRDGLSAMDALHIAAAILSGCEEFVTAEKPQKAIRGIL